MVEIPHFGRLPSLPEDATLQPPHNNRSSPILLYAKPFQAEGGRGKGVGRGRLEPKWRQQEYTLMYMYTCYERRLCDDSVCANTSRDMHKICTCTCAMPADERGKNIQSARRSPSMKTPRPPHLCFTSVVNSTPLRSVPTNNAAFYCHPPILFYAKAVVANVFVRALRVYALHPTKGCKGRPPPPKGR
jgi:hypothetical protein